MKIHVMVATTQGLVAIQKIYRQDPDIRSVVSINGTTTVSPISAAYHLFVTKGVGIIENHFGGASYRVNIASQIDQGNSWQLGFYLAHAAEAQGMLGNGQPQVGDAVICASGEINTSELSVLAVDDIARKIQHAVAQIKQWPIDISLKFILPKANGFVAPDSLSAPIKPAQLHYVESVAQALSLLPIKPTASIATAAPKIQVHRLRLRLSPFRLAILLLIIGAPLAIYMSGVWDTFQSVDRSEPLATQSPGNTIAYDTLVQFTHTATHGTDTHFLRLGYTSSTICDNSRLSYQTLAAANNHFAASAHAQLCDIRFYSKQKLTAVVAINIHSHRFVQASQQADEFIIPVPQRSATYLLLGFTSVLKPATLKALHGYLFNLPEQHILSEAELNQVPALDELEYQILRHQLTQGNTSD